MPDTDRSAQRLYAETFGYFWAPCPLCGVEFGGHEWQHDKPGHSIPTGEWSTTTAVCTSCGERRQTVVEAQGGLFMLRAVAGFTVDDLRVGRDLMVPPDIQLPLETVDV